LRNVAMARDAHWAERIAVLLNQAIGIANGELAAGRSPAPRPPTVRWRLSAYGRHVLRERCDTPMESRAQDYWYPVGPVVAHCESPALAERVAQELTRAGMAEPDSGGASATVVVETTTGGGR
jgi:hypothetical protein